MKLLQRAFPSDKSLGIPFPSDMSLGKGPTCRQGKGRLLLWSNLSLDRSNVPRRRGTTQVKLYNVVGTREYELPTTESISAILFGETSSMENYFDLIVEQQGFLNG
ncbi:hypothetical protein Tco_0206847 [Tanacetum coccineum]